MDENDDIGEELKRIWTEHGGDTQTGEELKRIWTERGVGKMAGENDIGEVLQRAIRGAKGKAVKELMDAMYNAMVDSLPELKGLGIFKEEDLVIQALMDYAKQHGYLYVRSYETYEIRDMIKYVAYGYAGSKLTE